MCQESPVTCLAWPTMLIGTLFMLRPLEALLSGELDGTTDRQQPDNSVKKPIPCKVGNYIFPINYKYVGQSLVKRIVLPKG